MPELIGLSYYRLVCGVAGLSAGTAAGLSFSVPVSEFHVHRIAFGARDSCRPGFGRVWNCREMVWLLFRGRSSVQ